MKNRLFSFLLVVSGILASSEILANQALWDAAYQGDWDKAQWILDNDHTADPGHEFKGKTVEDLFIEGGKQALISSFRERKIGEARTATERNQAQPKVTFGIGLNRDIGKPKNIRGTESIGELIQMGHVPHRFDPAAFDCVELEICRKALDQIERAPGTPEHLATLAQTNFILGCVYLVPDGSLSFNAMDAVRDFIPKARQMKLCDKSGAFFTNKLLPDQLMWHLVKVPNFFKAFFLVQRLNLSVTPKVLQKLSETCSAKKFETRCLEYYSSLANFFIPNLCQTVLLPGSSSNYSVFCTISKLITEFPVELREQTVGFVRAFNEKAFSNLLGISTSELMELLRLNEIAEIAWGQTLMDVEAKGRLLDRIISQKADLSEPQLLMLMNAQYTIFKDLDARAFVQLKSKFRQFYRKMRQIFANADKHEHEQALVEVLRANLPEAHRPFLEHSFVCPLTAREIDIAYSCGGKKVAVHLDGMAFHCFLDRDEADNRTKIRNASLEGAGWINVCVPLARGKAKGAESKAKRDLLNRVSDHLPLMKPFFIE